ncbi:MAG: 1,4-dihydroxy-2-naphthoate octaprenyltransferase [Candidatus Bathyarchaeota archaeon]|nr:1,4-dihydroxy-2-naphthoate octaprenyltransferase [Candidatus Bathyarchaeota archaeon]
MHDLTELHNHDEILSTMDVVNTAFVSTAAGSEIRSRMMHYWNDESFNIYLASMKGDPKTLQITENPTLSLLILNQGENINESAEVEVTGKAYLLKDGSEKNEAFKALAGRSPVVGYLKQTESLDLLDCIKVVPLLLKYRIFGEIVQGQPPTVLEFSENVVESNECSQLRSKLRHWTTALRFLSLVSVIVPIILGASIAWMRNGAFNLTYFILTLIGGLAVQAGSNVINDYYDYKSGNDNVNREYVRPFSGGSRMIQLGLLTPLEVLSGALALFALATGIGLFLSWKIGYTILVLGIIGVFSGYFYTAPPLNLASRGIGEAVVGLNFGVLMVLGSYYVQTGTLAVEPLVASIPVSLLIAAVLYINEFPDYVADKAVGKDTLVVRLGRNRAVFGFMMMFIGTYGALALALLYQILPIYASLGFLTIPFAVKAVGYATRYHSKSFDLVPANILTIITHLFTSLLLSLGYLIEGLGPENLGLSLLIGGAYAVFIIYMYKDMERKKNIFLGLKTSLQT